MKQGTNLTVAPGLIDAILRVGRFRHGSRSIKAVVETSNLSHGTFDFKHLAEDHILELHADRGPLDPDAIGGVIVLSGFPDDPDNQIPLVKSWLGLAREFWQQGATLAYGGRFDDVAHGGANNLAAALVQEASGLPRALRRYNDKRPRLICFQMEDMSTSKTEGVFDSLVKSHVVSLRTRPSVSEGETSILKEKFPVEEQRDWIKTVLDQFRPRLDLTESAVARFAMAGLTQGYPGRFPGIAEEIMLTLALGKPVYIAGGHHGAAEDVGAVLGLARPLTCEPVSSFMMTKDQQINMSLLQSVRELLQPPPWNNLPVTMAELLDFFRDYAVGGNRWPDNGLSVEENRELFRSTRTDDIARLVIKGLRTLLSN